jgi:pimeloyl-ACP methyl ester carboxylesterase
MLIKTVTLPSHPISFTYTDSGDPGSPESGLYTTVFFIHGITFHGSIFEKLRPEPYNLRVICLNRRGYGGSTDFQQDELKELNDPFCDKVQWLRVQGLYLALAIDRLLLELHLPEETGFALCAWSLGTVFALGILDSLNSALIPEDTRLRVIRYFRKLIFYGEPPLLVSAVFQPRLMDCCERRQCFNLWSEAT